ncbi:GTP-binding protein [Arenibacter sp. 6A1]|uniref:GTP-binding protein n=1 Tax=Arenibacter sp. 6A1 TaxID=2720391 RepID=UPI00197B0779|nr:GTP-binding protein [Arenibacter sp. 6A1]
MTLISNEIASGSRFQLTHPLSKEKTLASFEKSRVSPFIVKRSDDHIFIKFDAQASHFWSPQLQLEILEKDKDHCLINGLFGPNPTLWTFFMFLHFGAVTLLIIIAIWAYTHHVLHKAIALQMGLFAFVLALWAGLYFFGLHGKRKGKPQVAELILFIKKTLKNP